MQIYKHRLPLHGSSEIPQCSAVLSVGVQDNTPYCWYRHEGKQSRQVLVLITGQHFDMGNPWRFVGTFQLEDTNGAPYVGHVLERPVF